MSQIRIHHATALAATSARCPQLRPDDVEAEFETGIGWLDWIVQAVWNSASSPLPSAATSSMARQKSVCLPPSFCVPRRAKPRVPLSPRDTSGLTSSLLFGTCRFANNPAGVATFDTQQTACRQGHRLPPSGAFCTLTPEKPPDCPFFLGRPANRIAAVLRGGLAHAGK